MPFPLPRHETVAFALALTLGVVPAAEAGWREDIGTFRVGLVTQGGGPVVDGADLMKQAFSDALDMPVEIFVARDQAVLIDAQASKRVDYAVYSALAYATARKLCSCVLPVAAPVALSGATGVRMVLFRRKWVEGTGQPVIAVPPENALLPHLLLDAARGAVAAETPYEVRVANSMEQAEELFAGGEAAALLGWIEEGGREGEGGTAARLAARGMARDEYDIAWKSEPLRYGPHAVRADLDPQAIEMLREWLVSLKETKPDVFEALSPTLTGGFAPVTLADYQLAEKLVAGIAPDAGAAGQ